MTNNYILRRLRYILDYDDSKMIDIFNLADYEASRAQISDWLKKDTDPDFRELSDKRLAVFLNGLINEKRGKKDGVQAEAEEYLDNNDILRKLKIAFNFKDFEMLEILDLAGRKISKHELSAFFRKPTQKQYRPCQDQILRNFLQGMQKKYRGNN